MTNLKKRREYFSAFLSPFSSILLNRSGSQWHHREVVNQTQRTAYQEQQPDEICRELENETRKSEDFQENHNDPTSKRKP